MSTEFFALIVFSAFMALLGLMPGRFWPKVFIGTLSYGVVILGSGLLVSRCDTDFIRYLAGNSFMQFPLVVYLYVVGMVQTQRSSNAAKKDGMQESTFIWHTACLFWIVILCPITLMVLIAFSLRWWLIVLIMIVAGGLITWYWSTLLDDNRREVISATCVASLLVLAMSALLIFHNKIIG